MEQWYVMMGGIITNLISAFTGWFFSKKKYQTEVDNNLIDNMRESLDFYKSLADDNKRRLEEVLSENVDLRKEVASLREQVLRLTSALADYGLKQLVDEKKIKG